MNFKDTNPKMKDMMVDIKQSILIPIFNDLKIPILINLKDDIKEIKSNKKILNVKINNPVKLVFRLPKIFEKKTNFTDGKNFEIIFDTSVINDNSFKNYIMKYKEIHDFYHQYIKNI